MFSGSIVAIVTPMQEGGNVDFPALERLVHLHLDAGTQGIVTAGSTGEGQMLSSDEALSVLRFVLERVRNRIPVIAATGSFSTQQTIERTRAALQAGADACLVTAPPYVRAPQRGLYEHFKTLAQTVPIPIILYNVPGRAACDMLPETVAQLANIPNIVGIKEASPDKQRVRRLLELCGQFLSILSGEDDQAMQAMLDGARGVISVTANVAPRAMRELCDAALSNDKIAAEALNERLLGLHQRLFIEPNPIPVKWALAEMGWITPDVRLPLVPLAPEHHDAVRKALFQAEVL